MDYPGPILSLIERCGCECDADIDDEHNCLPGQAEREYNDLQQALDAERATTDKLRRNIMELGGTDVALLQADLAAEHAEIEALKAELNAVDDALGLTAGGTGLSRREEIDLMRARTEAALTEQITRARTYKRGWKQCEADLAAERERADEQTERARKYKRAWTRVESDLVDAEDARDAAIERADSADARNDDLLERCEELQQALQAERERADEATVRLKSLLAELWDGVRIHGLRAPERGRDGERLIHAYCGGIVEAMEQLDAAIERAEKAEESERSMHERLQRLVDANQELKSLLADAANQVSDANAAANKAEAEVERLRGLIDDLATYIQSAAPDGDAWCDDGGLADRVDALAILRGEQ